MTGVSADFSACTSLSAFTGVEAPLACWASSSVRLASRDLAFLLGLSGVCEREDAGLDRGEALWPLLFHSCERPPREEL